MLQLHQDVINAVHSFYIVLQQNLMQVATLRDGLWHLQYLEDLQLIIPCLKPSGWTSLLCHVCFPYLDLLYTNAPHDIVLDFLWSHPRIAYMSLGKCVSVRKLCPLDGRQLPKLCDISGLAHCVASLIKQNPVTHVAAHQPLLGGLLVITVLMQSLSLIMVNLTVLELDVDTSDYNILQWISKAAPALRSLKLLEVQSVNTVICGFVWALLFLMNASRTAACREGHGKMESPGDKLSVTFLSWCTLHCGPHCALLRTVMHFWLSSGVEARVLHTQPYGAFCYGTHLGIITAASPYGSMHMQPGR